MELLQRRIVFLIIIICWCRVSTSTPGVISNDGRIDLKMLDKAEDNLIYKLYGDFDIGAPHSRYSSHSGDDNAVHYSNEWLVHIEQGDQFADHVASDAGYKNLGEVKGFPRVYHFVKNDHPEIHHRGARDLTKQLISNYKVTWAEQQYAKKRAKRDFSLQRIFDSLDLPNFLKLSSPIPPQNEIQFNDPLWYKQWYIQDTRTRTSLPRLDLNVLPVFQMGYTGKGVNVVVLDDGLEHTHEDLRDNYNPKTSGDLNDNDNDPMPIYNKKPPNSHGTRCAGEISMKANNSKCGVGIAYESSIGGVRMLDGPVSDRIEGEALSFSLPLVDAYSASWGPSDDGETVEGPGRLAQSAFVKGVTEGRNGKGVIFVWASGNGGANGDCCSVDGYASNIYTLSIGSASESGSFPWYGEQCPSTMAVTYSSGAYTDQKIATADIMNACTTGHTGTSASAPLAAGIVALALQANPNLTWRDVQHLMVWTSQPDPLLNNPGWKINAAGFQFNSRFGYGLMDATGMVKNALNWITVPPQKSCRIPAVPLKEKNFIGSTPKVAQFYSTSCSGTGNEINYLEHIEVLTTVQYSLRGSLQIDLTSPSGTTTRLLFSRKKDQSATGFIAWPFVSSHTWGEHPNGTWKLTFTDVANDPANEGSISGLELILYGTTEEPEYLKSGPRIYPKYYKKSMTRHLTEEAEDHQEVNRMNAILQDLNVEDWIY